MNFNVISYLNKNTHMITKNIVRLQHKENDISGMLLEYDMQNVNLICIMKSEWVYLGGV